jgi:predicted DNA-binding protein YlxM (UPF0122 family)
VFDIKRESQAVLDSIKEITSRVFLMRGQNNGIAVYVPKDHILKEIAAKIQ